MMRIIRKIIEYAFYLYVFLIPWQARIIFSQGALNGQPWEYGTISMYLSEALLLLIAVLALLVHLKDYDEEIHYKGRKALNIFLLAVLLLIAAGITGFFAIDRGVALQALIRLFEGVALFLVVNEIKISVHALAWFVAASAAVQGAFASLQFYSQEIWASTLLGVSEKLPQMLGISVIETSAGRFLRAYGTFAHPNILAAFLVVGLVFSLGLLFTNRNKIEKTLVYFGVVLMSAGLFFAFSRSAYLVLSVALISATIYLMMNKDRQLNIVFFKFLGLLFAPLLFLAVVNSGLVFNHYLSPSIASSASVNDRVMLLGEARQLVQNHWLKGVGIGNYTLAAFQLDSTRAGQAYQPVHNVLLLALVETGLLGVLILLLLLQEIIKAIVGFKVTYNKDILSELAQFEGAKMYQKDYGYITYWHVLLSCLVIGFIVWFFFDHFFWTLYSGIILFWLVLGVWVKMLIRLKT